MCLSLEKFLSAEGIFFNKIFNEKVSSKLGFCFSKSESLFYRIIQMQIFWAVLWKSFFLIYFNQHGEKPTVEKIQIKQYLRN